jgi:Glycosyltransferase family 87
MDLTESSVGDPSTGRLSRLLDRPLPARQCVLGWVVATIVFFGIVALLGGPTVNDAQESMYSTWAVQHGDFACAYPPAPSGHLKIYPNYAPGPYSPPLWPLISGGLAEVTGLGKALPFPSQAQLGAGCSHAFAAIYHWARPTRVLYSTIGFGYLTWFAVLAGAVAVLRAAGRGRTGWEVAGVVLIALLPSGWDALMNEYHPQDLLALGLLLGALACGLRRSWLWAGILIGLAVSSQQFALLALAPLFVVAPGRARWRLAVGAVAAWLVVAVPFITQSRRAFNAVTIGTGNSPSYGGTWVRFLHLSGAPLVLVSRVLPIVAAIALAWWLLAKLDEKVLDPVPLLSLITVCLSLRLVFEQNMFGYYFMAMAVLLVLLEVVDGRLRGELLAWVAMILLLYDAIPFGLAYNAVSWGERVSILLPEVAMAIVLALIIWDAVHRRIRLYLVAWLVVAVSAFGRWPPWIQTWPGWNNAFRPPFHHWTWQIILLPTGIALAVWPLLPYIRGIRGHGDDDVGVPKESSRTEAAPAGI